MTKELFRLYPTAFDLAKADIEKVEEIIKSCGFYKNKAKNIVNACKMLIDRFGGEVPSSHGDLVSLPGVGNKTANVVQAVGFNIPAFAVDTHILRVSNRLGLVKTGSPDKCEEKLKSIFKKEQWGDIHHLMLLFGRYYCLARNPKCENCVLKDICINSK